MISTEHTTVIRKLAHSQIRVYTRHNLCRGIEGMSELTCRFHGLDKGAFYAYAYIICTQYMYTSLSSSSSVTSYVMIGFFRTLRIVQDHYICIKHMYLYEHILEASVPTMLMV